MCITVFHIGPPVTNLSICREDDPVAGNKDEKDAVLPSCSNGHDEPSTSKGCQKEATVRNRST